MIELGTPALYLKARLGVAGPAYTVSTACSSSTKTFAAARRLISSGLCDAVVTGGVDSRCRFAMNGFHALGALSEGRCRPLAEDRDGINLGEGVAIFAVERAELSPGKVVVKGVGESSDAYHATAPDPEGRGAEAAMRLALDDAGMQPGDVDYVNLHGTGTFANDAMELKAVERVFGSVRYESTKNLTGHCLGAAGAVEAAICALRIENGDVRAALSNSFAFGGSNASVVLGVRG
jgi:3-oxoacyl-[acyl-carrier-protein] synthase-1